MSWSFSRGLVAAFLDHSCLDTKPSVQSSMTLTPDQYYWPDKTTEHSRISRFGMTCEPLMANLGAELLTWFRAVSLAKTYPLQGVAMDWTVNVVDSGGKWRESLARYDQPSHSLKTAQLSLIEDWTGFSLTLPRSGLMLGGQCWELPMLGRITKGIESGFLPTPVATDAGSGRFNTSIGGTPRPTLALMARKRLWPTPTAHNAKETNAASESARNTPTLAAQDGGHLNPSWVEQLMGWPTGHTDLKRLATAKFHSVGPQPGESLEASK